MNLSIPDAQKSMPDEQACERRSGISGEHPYTSIERDRDRLKLRGLLAEGAASSPAQAVGDAYFDNLRRRTRNANRADKADQ